MRPRPYLLSFLVLGLAACGGGTDPGSERCDAGTVVACTCADGAAGQRTCDGDGRFGACDCASDTPILKLGGLSDPLGEADRLVQFGAAPVDGAVEASLPVENTGTGTLNLSLSSVSPPFALVSAPTSLAAGEAGTLRFRFSPRTPGEARTTVTVSSNGGGATIRFTGEGFEPEVACTPDPLDLGTVVVGVPASFTLTCTDGSGASWPATAWAEGTDARAVTVALQDPLPDEGGTWTITGTLTAIQSGTQVARIAFGAGEAALATVPLRATARAEALELPDTVDLGFAVPGFPRSVSLPIRNYGPEAVVVEGISLAPESAPGFAVETVAPLTVPAAAVGEPGTAEVTFAFTAADEQLGSDVNGALLLAIAGEPRPREVALAAIVGGPVISCSPEALGFGTVGLGVPTTLPLTCTNAGTDLPGRLDDNLVLDTLDTGDSPFTAALRGAPRPGGYAAGESFTVEVTVAPAVAGTLEGTLLVSSNAGNGPRSIPLEALAVDLPPCNIELPADRLDFGTVDENHQVTLEFAVQNLGSGRCQLRNLRLAEGCDPAFSLPGAPVPSHLLDPGGELRVPVRFAPTGSPGVRRCEARLDVSNPAAPVVAVPLEGRRDARCLVFEPADFDFGPVAPGCRGRSRTVRVTNACIGGPTEVTAIELASAASGEFVIEELPPLPAALAYEASLEFTVGYGPEQEGQHWGGIRLRTAGGSEVVGVHGTGTDDPVRSDVFRQAGPPQVDVLFAIDTSDSRPEQENLAANVPALLSHARAMGLDIQIGVTSVADGRLYPVDGSRPRIVRASTPESVLAENFRLGSIGYGHQVLAGALGALTPPADRCDHPNYPQPNDGNCGFVRPGAHLAVVGVAPDGESSPGTVQEYAAAFRALKGDHPDQVRVHAITGDRGTGCATSAGMSPPGDKLIDVAAATGGSFHSVCATDWAAELAALSRDVFTVESCFDLGSVPDPGPDGHADEGDLAVTMAGQAVPPTGREGVRIWSYRPDVPRICFSPEATPTPGATFQVTYRPACL